MNPAVAATQFGATSRARVMMTRVRWMGVATSGLVNRIVFVKTNRHGCAVQTKVWFFTADLKLLATQSTKRRSLSIHVHTHTHTRCEEASETLAAFAWCEQAIVTSPGRTRVLLAAVGCTAQKDEHVPCRTESVLRLLFVSVYSFS